MVFTRRTLPWERRIDSDANPLPEPKDNSNPPNGEVPWVALLLFEEGEYTLLSNQPLESVVPSKIFAALGSPANILCDAIETDPQLLAGILPSREELQLLCHVRQVNVEDRELNAGSSDGFFSVVMSNRLPAPQTKCRACFGAISAGLVQPGGVLTGIFVQPKPRLVLLHSWQFTVTGPMLFRTLMQNLDVGMFGETRGQQPELSDTGHLRLPVLDRAGQTEIVWYRGPLTPWQLTREPYRQAARSDTITKIQATISVDLPSTVEERLDTPIAAAVSVSASTAIAGGGLSVADRFGINIAAKTVGMDPQNASRAWGLGSVAAAEAVLGGDAATLGATVAAVAQTPRPSVTLEQVASDSAALDHLTNARARVIGNAIVKTGGGTR